MPQTLKEILNENKALIAGVAIPYFLAAGLIIGAEKGIISTPDVYARRLYRAIAGEKYRAYLAIGIQIPISGINQGIAEGDKIQFTGRSIEVLVINTIKKEIRVSINNTPSLLLNLGESKHTQNGGIITLLDLYEKDQKDYADLAISDWYEMRMGDDAINDFFCPREIKLLSVSDSKAVVQLETKKFTN